MLIQIAYLNHNNHTDRMICCQQCNYYQLEEASDDVNTEWEL
jgi:hypothetical protein